MSCDVTAMSEEAFWLIVDEAAAGATSEEVFLERAGALLEGLAPGEILGFRDRLDALVRKAHRWDLWGAAWVINGGCSDDCFEYFRAWLVSLGREAFEAAVANPESLVAYVPMDPVWEAESEEFLYLPVYVYELKTDDELPLPEVVGGVTEPSGERIRFESLETRFPELSRQARERFGLASRGQGPTG